MRKMFQYRIYPTKKQVHTLNDTLEECRWLYNHLLEKRKDTDEHEGISLSLYQQQETFSILKHERPALKGVHSQVLQNVAVRIDLAMKAFFRRCKEHAEKPGFPRFKGYGRYDSFTFPQSGFSITHDNRVVLSKIGALKMVYHRPIRGKIKTCTIHRSSTGKWYVSFSVECVPERLPDVPTQVGIDVGLKTFATLSTGEEIANPRFFRKEEKALAKVQQKHATLATGTLERRKHRKAVARVHERIAWRRANFTHQESRKIVNAYGVLCVEDLHVNRITMVLPRALQMPRGRPSLPNSLAKRKRLAERSSKSIRPIRRKIVAGAIIGKRCRLVSVSIIVPAASFRLIET